MGKVYVNKVIHFNFESDYKVIRFSNNYAEEINVEVALEGQTYVVEKGVDDDEFNEKVSKMNKILHELENTELNREKRYKW